MFGFIRPLKSELKVREWERFQSFYCGLCHTIRSRYGIAQTLLLSYDCTYLALVLDSTSAGCETCRRRCITHPFRRRTCAHESDGIRHAAAEIIAGEQADTPRLWEAVAALSAAEERLDNMLAWESPADNQRNGGINGKL